MAQSVFGQILRTISVWGGSLTLVCKNKKKEIWLRPMTKTPIPTENSKTNGQHKNATKNFDYTTIADSKRFICFF